MPLLSPRPRTTPARRVLPAALGDRLQWQKKPPRYRDARTGRYLTPAVVRGVIDDEIDAANKRLRGHSADLQNGRVDLNTWRDRVADEIKLLHLANVAAAKGGFAQLTADDYKRVSGAVKRQYRYLENFARALDANPSSALGDGFLNRTTLYGEAARESYEEARRDDHKAKGYLWEKNILHARESCKARHGRKGCSELAALGYVPIGTLPAVGRRACFARCKCTILYSDSPTRP